MFHHCHNAACEFRRAEVVIDVEKKHHVLELVLNVFEVLDNQQSDLTFILYVVKDIK